MPVAWLRKSRGTYSIKPAFDESEIKRLLGNGYELLNHSHLKKLKNI